MVRKSHIALLLFLASSVVMAQPSLMEQALARYQAGALNEARALVDEALDDADVAADPETWLLRGFILKDLYKSTADQQGGDAARDEGVRSLERCLELDAQGTYRENAEQALDYLTRTYFNDAARMLNETRPEEARDLFGKYADALVRSGKGPPDTGRRVEFNNALGTVYTKQYNQQRDDLSLYDKAVSTFEEVLVIEPLNYGANYNLATLHYNRGVFNIQRIGTDSDIPSIQRIQEASKEFFMKALPYMLKAHEMNPTRRETLLGLEGIYYSLQDVERSEYYRGLYEQLGPEDDR